MNISETNSSSVADHLEPIYTASYAINIILGLPTNVCVLWLIVTGAGGTIASQFFTLNLTVSEILYCLFSLVRFLCKFIQTTAVPYIEAFSIGLLHTGRPLFQSCICVERYLAVVRPVFFLNYKPLRYRVGCCGVAWLIVLGSSLFFVRALKQPGLGDGDRERERTNSMKMRAYKIIWIILVAMMVNYLPEMVIMTLHNVLDEAVRRFSFCISDSITMIFGIVQPLLYLHRVGKLPCISGL